MRLNEVAIKGRLVFYFVLAAWIAGCATTPPGAVQPPAAPMGMPGVYHRVERGQTLWRIARAYDVDMEQLAGLNRISDASAIEAGQLIFIPGRQKQIALPQPSGGDDFIWPAEGRVINSFGQSYGSMINKGINISPVQSRQVKAARSGKVVFYSNNFGNFGKTVIIDHGDGMFTVYSRNAEVFVKPGDDVSRGAVIARAGSAGRDGDEYLHFEVRQGHIPRNPLFYLPR